MPNRIIKNPEQFRANVCKKLDTYFNDTKHAINLEKGIHNWTINEATKKKVVKKWDNPFFVQIYVDHLRSIYFNLNNQTLIDKINNGDVKTQDVAFMTHQELRPDIWDDYIKAKSVRDMHKFSKKIEAMTDRFTCGKCHKKECSYYLQQLRSSDEPMTMFISCLACGNRWRKNG